MSSGYWPEVQDPLRQSDTRHFRSCGARVDAWTRAWVVCRRSDAQRGRREAQCEQDSEEPPSNSCSSTSGSSWLQATNKEMRK